MDIQVQGLLAPLFIPLFRWQEQKRQEDIQKLLARAYTGDQTALSELISRYPEQAINMGEALKQQQEAQLNQLRLQSIQDFQNTLQPKPDWSQWMPEGSVLTPEQMKGLLTGKTPTQAGIPEPPMKYPSQNDILMGMLKVLAPAGNFSELSGYQALEEAGKTAQETQRAQELWDWKKGIVGNIAEQGLTPEEAVKLQTATSVLEGKPQYITGAYETYANIQNLMLDAFNKVSQGIKIDTETELLKQEMEKLAVQTENLKKEGQLKDAELYEKLIVNAFLPQLQSLEIQNEQLKGAKLKAETTNIQTKTADIQREGTKTTPAQSKKNNYAIEFLKNGYYIDVYGAKTPITNYETALRAVVAVGADINNPDIKALLDAYKKIPQPQKPQKKGLFGWLFQTQQQPQTTPATGGKALTADDYLRLRGLK